MAGNTPTLTNENYHMFQPSQIETSLVNALDDPFKPSAFPMLMAYRADRQSNQSDYQSNINAMHGIQQQQAADNAETARRAQFATTLKDISMPGQASMAQQMGLIPEGVDTTSYMADLRRSSDAKIAGDAGRGLGAAAMGGITGLAPAAQSAFGPGAGQGAPAIVQAAQIHAASRGAGEGKVTVHEPVGDVGPNQASVSYKLPMTSLPGLKTTATKAPASGDVNAMQSRVNAGLPNVAAANPAAHADMIAGGAKVVFDAGHNTYVVQGKNNKYPVAPFLK